MKLDRLFINKNLDGDLTPEQQDELRQWFGKSVKHRQLLIDIQTRTDTNDSCKELYKADFERRLDAVDTRRWLIARRKKRIAAFVAAAMIIPAALLLLIPDRHHSTQAEGAVGKSDIAEVRLVVNDQVIALNQTTDTIAANIVNNNGQIVYNTSQSVEVKINKLITPRGKEHSVKLCDGTVVWLNAASELTYPDRFDGNERRVSLKGEAYFDVAKQSQHRFVVEAEGIDVNVYGTRFNVNTHSQDVEVLLVEGSIALDHNDSHAVCVKPSQLALYNKNSSVIIVKSVDVMNYVAWRYGEYRFEDEKLCNILDDLSLWYDVEVSYANPALKELVFTCYLPKTQDISELLRHIEKTSYIKFELDNKLLIVK